MRSSYDQSRHDRLLCEFSRDGHPRPLGLDAGQQRPRDPPPLRCLALGDPHASQGAQVTQLGRLQQLIEALLWRHGELDDRGVRTDVRAFDGEL